MALAVTEPSEAGEVRRQAARLAAVLGLGETDAGRVALVATELAGNLAKHARGGSLLLHPRAEDGRTGVEMLALDRGPGIGNVAEALRDGYSTAGTPGTGLGAAMRVADRFDIHSVPGAGTAIVAQLWSGGRGDDPAPGAGFGVVRIAKPGEEACGDGVALLHDGSRTRMMVADGLGHGVGASEAAAAAARAFEANAGHPLPRVMERLHGALRHTRGAAIALAEVDRETRALTYVGVGNISGVIVAGGTSQSLVSHNGTVGFQLLRVKEFAYAWPEGALLVMHSDGIGSRWTLDGYPGLAARHPSLVAGVLYRDFSRGRDDSTVAVFADGGRPA